MRCMSLFGEPVSRKKKYRTMWKLYQRAILVSICLTLPGAGTASECEDVLREAVHGMLEPLEEMVKARVDLAEAWLDFVQDKSNANYEALRDALPAGDNPSRELVGIFNDLSMGPCFW